jgi:glycosyltransferase involved in cell wall biosynthesis
VRHFLIVDNASTDGTAALLAANLMCRSGPRASYKLSRFGMDWITWLLMRHGHGHWCVTVDADELLIYPHWETRPCLRLTGWLDAAGPRCFGAMMLDLYPRVGGPTALRPRPNPLEQLHWFDSGNYT